MHIFSSLLYLLPEHGREVMHYIFDLTGFNFYGGKKKFSGFCILKFTIKYCFGLWLLLTLNLGNIFAPSLTFRALWCPKISLSCTSIPISLERELQYFKQLKPEKKKLCKHLHFLLHLFSVSLWR